MDKNKILKEKYDWLEKDDFWKAFNTWVIKHDAVMRIAEEEGIVFNTPKQVLMVKMYGQRVKQLPKIARIRIFLQWQKKDGKIVQH